MFKLSKASAAAAIVCLMATVVFVSEVFVNSTQTRRLYDSDEAAWVFNAAYLGPFLAQDRSHACWTAYDEYAQHPPSLNYVFGAAMLAIGQPVESFEPRAWWFENDRKLSWAEYEAGLLSRMTWPQLFAARMVSALSGLLAAIALGLFARRTLGAGAGVAAYAAYLLSPTVLTWSSVAQGDQLLTFAAFVAYLGAINAVESVSSWRRLTWVAVVGISLGFAMSGKLSAFVFAPGVAAIGLLWPSTLPWARRAALVTLMATATFVAMVFFDPALDGDPVGVTLARLETRAAFSQVVQAADPRIAESIGERLWFAARSLVAPRPDLSGAAAAPSIGGWVEPLAFAALAVVGLVAMLAHTVRDRRWGAARAIAAFHLLGAIYILEMAWSRYVLYAAPVYALLAAAGASWLLSTKRRTQVQSG